MMLCFSFSFPFLFGVTLPRAAHLIIYVLPNGGVLMQNWLYFREGSDLCKLKVYNLGKEIDVVLEYV